MVNESTKCGLDHTMDYYSVTKGSEVLIYYNTDEP